MLFKHLYDEEAVIAFQVLYLPRFVQMAQIGEYGGTLWPGKSLL